MIESGHTQRLSTQDSLYSKSHEMRSRLRLADTTCEGEAQLLMAPSLVRQFTPHPPLNDCCLCLLMMCGLPCPCRRPLPLFFTKPLTLKTLKTLKKTSDCCSCLSCFSASGEACVCCLSHHLLRCPCFLTYPNSYPHAWSSLPPLPSVK